MANPTTFSPGQGSRGTMARSAFKSDSNVRAELVSVDLMFTELNSTHPCTTNVPVFPLCLSGLGMVCVQTASDLFKESLLRMC